MVSPRKSRKSVLELMDSVEELLEGADVAWCDGVSRSGTDRLGGLAAALASVESLQCDGAALDSVEGVSSMLDVLRGCGGGVVQGEVVLAEGHE